MRLRIALPVLASAVVASGIAGVRAQQVNPSLFGELHWRNVGPPRSGYVSAPAGVPGDPTTYYAGMPEGGVWKTTNGGVTWKPIFDAVGVASVGAVAVAPSDPNVVFAGTGNQSGWSFTTGKGVYKSTDAGKTWTNVGLLNSQYIGAIVVDPRSANTVLVAVQGARAGGAGRGAAPASTTAATAAATAGQERGVYRTSDGGRSWARVLQTDGFSGASDLWMDYGDPQIVYASVAAGSGTGISKSIDCGVTWAPAGGKGLPDGARIAAFTVASGTHGKRLYALAGGGGRGAAGAGARGLYRSDDGGETWIFGTSQLASAGGKMYADPQRPDIVYIMGTAIYRSTNAGTSVAAFWGAPSGADPRFMWIDPTNSKRMMVGVDQGIAISVDDGATFSPYYGVVNGQFYRVATDYDTPYHVCGPQQDSGTACVPSRTDFGEIRPSDWYAGGGFEDGFLIADPLDHRYMYTQGWYHVLRRFDRTTSQVVVLYQPKSDDRFGGAPPLAFSPDGHTLYMCAQYVMASTDRGETWTRLSEDLLVVPAGPEATAAPGERASGRGAPAAGGSIQSFAASPVNASVLWAGTSNGLIWVSKDAGKTWAHVTMPNPPPGGVNIIDASHKDRGTAYAAMLSRDSHPHLFRTSDYGAHWQEISAGLEDGDTMRVVREDPVDPNVLYAGSVTSAYVSFDRGDHWQSLQLNLPHTVVSDMTVKDNDLVISTYGRGFWILDDVSPLRQIASAKADAAPVHFFAVSPASRMRWDNTQDTPLPPEMKVGDNPLEGAVFDYYLAQPATGGVVLTIGDRSGKTIREFSSDVHPPDPTMPNVPEYWLMKPQVLPTTSGHHRVSWDLRYPDPPALNFSYYGNMIDYREYTLNWHALPGQTYISTIVGPMVPLGTYTATLTVNGRNYAQPFHVVPDPRVKATAADIEAQFNLQMRMVAGLETTFDAYNFVQKLRDSIATRAQDPAIPAAFKTAAQPVDAALVPVQTAIGTAHRDLGRRLNDQTVGDLAPNKSVIDGVDEPCAAIDKALEALRRQTPKIDALIDMLKSQVPNPPICQHGIRRSPCSSGRGGR
jgi:photosystem II stability/assembly factor-like uncharacterized protein